MSKVPISSSFVIYLFDGMPSLILAENPSFFMLYSDHAPLIDPPLMKPLLFALGFLMFVLRTVSVIVCPVLQVPLRWYCFNIDCFSLPGGLATLSSAARKQEILKLTEQLLEAISAGDYETYA